MIVVINRSIKIYLRQKANSTCTAMSRDRDVGPIHACTLHTELRIDNAIYKQVVGGRPARYAPAPLLPTRAPKRFAPPSRQQRSSSFPRPARSNANCCSLLTRQHGGG